MPIQQWIVMLGALALVALASLPATPLQHLRSGASDYGVVQAIEWSRRSPALASARWRGVVGGVLGIRSAKGVANTAHYRGAAGGAYAGNEIQKRNSAAGEVLPLHVRLDNGATQTFDQEKQHHLRVVTGYES